MADANVAPEEMIPLSPTVFHIMLALAERELHGYGIMKQVAIDTRDKIQMGPGTLYGSIKRMLSADLIVESDERPDPILDDERRRYYRLTGFGRKVLVAEMNRLSNALAVAAKKGLSWPAPASWAMACSFKPSGMISVAAEGRILLSRVNSLSSTIGLARWASQPASRHLATSPVMALAVRATIGSEKPFCRKVRVAS